MGVRPTRWEGMDLVWGFQICTSLDHNGWGVGFSFEGSILWIVASGVSLNAFSNGWLDLVACFCFSSVVAGDGWVVLVVPLGNHWGLILARLGYIGLVYEEVSRATIASRGNAIYSTNGVWTYSCRVHWGGVATSCFLWMSSICGCWMISCSNEWFCWFLVRKEMGNFLLEISSLFVGPMVSNFFSM